MTMAVLKFWWMHWGGDQAYSRLSTTHGHITDCKLDSVVYADVCVCVNVDLSCLGRTIYARQFLGAKPPIQFRHRWAERNHSDHLYWTRAAQSVAKFINAKRQAEKRKPPSLYVFGVTRSGIEPRLVAVSERVVWIETPPNHTLQC